MSDICRSVTSLHLPPCHFKFARPATFQYPRHVLSLTNPSLPFIATLLLLAIVPSVVASIAVLLYLRRRGESRRYLQARVQELKLISDAVRAIASARLDEDELCKLVRDQVARFIDADTFQIGLFEGTYYIPRLRFNRSVGMPLEPFDLAHNGGIFGYLRESGRWLLVRDFDRELAMLPAKPRYINENPPKSAIFVPLVAVEGVIGAMAIQSDTVGAFTESHARLLSIIANQAAAAIQNARALKRERERARQFELVSQVAGDTALILNINTLLPRLIEAMQGAFGYYFMGIFLIDDETGEVVCRASTSNGELVNRRMKSGIGLIGASISTQGILVSPDVRNDPRYLHEPSLPDTRSEAVVPLMVAGQPIGALDLQSTRLNDFTHSDTRFLEILGQQVAVAIEDARLYEAEREQAWQSNALLQVAEISSRAEDLDDAVTAVARIVPKLSGVAMCAVLTTDEHAEQFVIAALEGRISDYENLGAGDTLLADDVPALRQMLVDHQPVMSAECGRLSQPMLALPLLGQGRLVGALLACQDDGLAFNPRRIDMMYGLANQAALVIDSVRARVAQKDEAWITAALLQVAQAVNQSDNLSAIAETVMSLTPLLVGVDACALFVREGQDTILRALRGYGFAAEAQQAIAQNELPMAAWRNWVLEHDNDALNKTLALEPVPERIASRLGDWNLAVLPLIAKNQLVGALIVAARNASQLPHDRTFRILLGIGQQSAVAMDNARLQLALFERRRLEQELNFARDIQRSFLPKEIPQVAGWSLAPAWQAARQVGGDFYDVIPLPNGRYNLVIADVADKGVPAALFMAMSRTLVRSAAFENYPPAALLTRVNQIILNDSNTDLFVTVFLARWDPASNELAFSNAGHNPPLIFRAACDENEARVEPNEYDLLPCIDQLPVRGIALGVVAGIKLKDELLTLHAGDVVLFYTDGIIDALNSNNEEFGLQRLQEVLKTTAALPATEIANAIMSAVSYFAGDEPPFDDQTLLVLKREASYEL